MYVLKCVIKSGLICPISCISKISIVMYVQQVTTELRNMARKLHLPEFNKLLNLKLNLT